MTRKLYLENLEHGYHHRFDATVTQVSEAGVVLDRTLFYPLGGGQHWDTGTLEGPNGTLQVTEVRGRGDVEHTTCLLYTSPSPRDQRGSRMPSSA